ncbi:hypothetical protein ACS0TY_017164 [Phlomoides rotata]
MRIGLKLVRRMEEWFGENSAEYSYMATENDNLASVKLFTKKYGYSMFRTPFILVQPVFAHQLRVDHRVNVIKLGAAETETLYRCRFSSTEFFPVTLTMCSTTNLTSALSSPCPRGRTTPSRGRVWTSS